MTTHPSAPAGHSQCAEILSELTKNAGTWVAMTRLVLVSGSYNVHSRISDLRKRGHVNEQENRRKPSSKTLQSFYKLNPTN